MKPSSIQNPNLLSNNSSSSSMAFSTALRTLRFSPFPPTRLSWLRHTSELRFFSSSARRVTRRPATAVQAARRGDEPVQDGNGSVMVVDENNRSDGRVLMTELHKEATEAYMAYAMSVLLGRALPDVRDGLKPVHRRILFAMHELSLSSKKPFKKCARVVGEVLGKFHPHGDSAVYDSLVRMAQDFSLRCPLIQGHGNFGSIDADPPAAMRYTECRLEELTEAMLLADLEQDTVDFVPNFDNSQKEPSLLPARLPTLLLNGSSGIAVGMATNIPPHNLGEVVEVLCVLIHNPEATLQELLEYMPGPDFPTGGLIMGNLGILEAYRTGRGRVIVRGKTDIELLDSKTKRTAIIIKEVPYQTNKAALVEKIAELVENKSLDGISDIRDESDRSGMRVVIELKRGSDPMIVLNNLYRLTSLQSTFSCNMVGILNGQPKLMGLKELLQIKNSRGDVLQCSHYIPIVSPEGKPLPCVIYCHGNSGCRADASEAAIILLPSNITVFALDFSGSGLSGGEHVTLGWNEKDDLRAVVNYLRNDGNVSLIGLWGRSMGAVTSLMYGAEDPSIAGMVLDSPFSDLVDLMMELVDTYKIRLPKFTVKFAIQYMRRAIQKKAKFDITDLNTIKVAKSCFVPALLGHAIDDDFINPHHSDSIFEAYMGDKNIIKFEGDHNSPRPQFYFDSINIFFHNVLQPPEDEVGESFFETVNDYFGKDVWRSVHDLGYSNESSSKNKDTESSTCSTIDAIKQVRSRRPMSRMEVPSDISSKDEHREHEQEKKCGDLSPSSSSMISFELSNGHPYGPHVPTGLDDDQFVEYPLDDLAGFPSSAEEEERMFMEAVMESLKDLDVRNPQAEQPPASTASVGPSDKDDSRASSQEISKPMETESLLVKHNTDSKSKTISFASEECVPLKTESNSVSVNHSQNLASKQSPVPSPSLGGAPQLPPPPPSPLETSSVTESNNSSDSARCDSSATLQSSSDTDISHNTKATVTVVRNPAGHVMDGLMRRWDFNFFKNSQNR